MGYVQVTPSVTLNNVTPFNIFLLDGNSDKSTVGLLYFCIFSILIKFKDDQRVMGWWCNCVTLVRVTLWCNSNQCYT